MSLQSKIGRLERATASSPEAMNERAWRETLNRLAKVYGDGQSVPSDAPVPTVAELEAIIERAYAGSGL